MNEWLLDLLGLRERVPPGAELRFEWGFVPQGEAGLLLLLCALGAGALTVALYRREGSASRWRKGFLAGVRLVVLAVLAGVLLEPRLAVDLRRSVEGQTILLWDASLSMSLPDDYRDAARRAEVARAAGLADPSDVLALSRREISLRLVERAELLEGLAARNQLAVYAFDRAPRRLAGPEALAALRAEGTATDLGAAVRKALEEAGAAPVAAVVAVTDGRITRGEGGQAVGEALAARGVPFFAVAVGDPDPPANLAALDLQADSRAVLGDPMVLEGRVLARGLAGRVVSAELAVRRAGQAEASIVERREVRFERDGSAVPLRFTYRPSEAGEFEFELRLPVQPEESDAEDNVARATTKVADDEARVLLVAGQPSFEYHFLRTRLVREKSAVVSCWLQSADPRFPQEGNEPLDAFPHTLEALQAFDCVVLLDPAPEDLDGPFCDALEHFVADHRGGLLYVAGPTYTPAVLAAPGARPLRDLLPVLPGDLETPVLATERFPCAVGADGVDHPVARLVPDGAACRALWARLPGFFFSYPVARAKAGAAVLARHADPSALGEDGGRPLLVAHYFGGAPVLFQGSDETWRWRSRAPRVYDRYWVNVIRYLVQGRLAGGRKRIEILPDREELTLGEPVWIRVRALDRAYRPLVVDALRGTLRHAGEEREVVFEPARRRAGQGWYEALVLPPGQGRVELSVRLPDDPPGAEPETRVLEVRRPDLEFAERSLDEEGLASIAEATGGALVRPEEVARLAERIPSRREEVVVAAPPIALWDEWPLFALVCCLLAVEWFVRKRSKMV